MCHFEYVWWQEQENVVLKLRSMLNLCKRVFLIQIVETTEKVEWDFSSGLTPSQAYLLPAKRLKEIFIRTRKFC